MDTKAFTLRNVFTYVAISTLFGVLISLGMWQLDRARQKSVRAATYVARAAERPVDLEQWIAANFADRQWRPVSARGAFVKPILLLDNRVRQGRSGVEILQPLRLVSGNVVLVNRGWLKSEYDRAHPPKVSQTSGQLTVTGHLGEVPITGIRLEQSNLFESMGNDLFRVQHIDLDQINARFKLSLLPLVVYLDPDSAGGFDRSWVPPGDGSSKHRAYAIQWFSMAAILVIIVAYQVRRKNQS